MKIPTTFTIPDTIGGVVELFKAHGWARAAIVAAYTKQGTPGRKANTTINRDISFPCSFEEFASLGVHGLTDPQTVAMYRQRWTDATTLKPKPGDIIDTSDLGDWPPTHSRYEPENEPEYVAAAEEEGVTFATAKRAGSNKAAIRAAIKADPAVAEAARDAITARDASSKKARDKRAANQPQDAPLEQFGNLHIQLRSAKRALTEALGYVIDIRGVTDTDEVRAAVSGYVGQLRHVLDLIDEAAQGKSLDDELAELLQDEELQ